MNREPPAVARMGLTRSDIAAWLAASCAVQGVSVWVSDPAVLDQVVVLLGGRAHGQRRQPLPVARPRESSTLADPLRLSA